MLCTRHQAPNFLRTPPSIHHTSRPNPAPRGTHALGRNVRVLHSSPTLPSVEVRKAFMHHEARPPMPERPNPLRRVNRPDLSKVNEQVSARFAEVQFSTDRPKNAHRSEWRWLQTRHPDSELRLFATPEKKEEKPSKIHILEVINAVRSLDHKEHAEKISCLEDYIFNKKDGPARFDEDQAIGLSKNYIS